MSSAHIAVHSWSTWVVVARCLARCTWCLKCIGASWANSSHRWSVQLRWESVGWVVWTVSQWMSCSISGVQVLGLVGSAGTCACVCLSHQRVRTFRLRADTLPAVTAMCVLAPAPVGDDDDEFSYETSPHDDDVVVLGTVDGGVALIDVPACALRPRSYPILSHGVAVTR